jgi:alkanesulfonate monooxygenase SsuD/methylene tetrahydromethanopterin reductase-like flavin-dependent oxidoreductase (luciferase family)
MRFGVVLGGDPTTVVREARLLEEHGIDTAWFPEAPLLGYGDPYVCMALAAQTTERLRLGTFIAPAAVHPAPMLILPFGTIGRIAPGRVRIGWGSGSFTANLLGMSPLKVRELRAELTVLRDLLDRGEAEFGGTSIRFATWNRPCLDLTEISLEVAAGGPRTAALAGEFGDGLLVSDDVRPEVLSELREAALAERKTAVGAHFPFTVDVGPLCVVRDGEPIDSARVKATVQPQISSYLGYRVTAGAEPDEVEPELRDGYARFRAWAHERYGQDPSVLHRAFCDGYLGRNEEHDRFLTPDVIRACTVTGPVEEIAERLREFARIGVTDLAIVPPLDRPLVDAGALADLVAVRERIG